MSLFNLYSYFTTYCAKSNFNNKNYNEINSNGLQSYFELIPRIKIDYKAIIMHSIHTSVLPFRISRYEFTILEVTMCKNNLELRL